MSRLIIKNLPREIKEDRLKAQFAAQGEVTDIQLKYTKAGVFRRFAFIGYRTEKEAERAVKFYDKSFIDSSRIQVEIAKDLGDSNLARPWSKYSEKSSAYQTVRENAEEKYDAKKLKKTKNQKSTSDHETGGDKNKKANLEKLEAEPEFQEFIEAHKGRSQKAVWGDDVSLPSQKSTSTKSKVTVRQNDSDSRSKVTVKQDDSDSSSGEDEDESSDDNDDEKMETEETGEEEDKEDAAPKIANQTTLSDMDYLKSKMVKPEKTITPSDDSSESDSEGDESSSDSVIDGVEGDEEEMDSGKGTTSEEEETDSSDDETLRTNKPSPVKETSAEGSKGKGKPLLQLVPKGKSVVKGKFVIKMKGIPYKVEEKNIVEFFHPIKLAAIRVPIVDNGQSKGLAFAEFSSEADLVEGMKRNKDYMGRRYVELVRDQKKDKSAVSSGKDKAPPWAKQAAELENSGEIIADTGRLFIRNLAYICREEDLESLFNKYGPLTEVNVPVDPLTKKIKGFAFITYMMPEHAVKAFTELDGTTFQGRLLHILPGKEKKSEEEKMGEGSSFKNKKKVKDKAMSSSSHNWNSLFISANAVADAMAERYQTTKGQVLDADSNRSLAVRMALGETQIVAETRQFLLDNGVALDSFSQASDKRSKTVILAKNLPAGTKEKEVRELFDKSGSLGRVVLPPAGVTAIVEFLEPSEARGAFYRLAYTKFQHVPLYLEWAPGNVFGEVINQQDVAETSQPQDTKTEDDSKEETKTSKKEKKAQKQSTPSKTADEEDVDEPEAGCTIFIKNLNFETVEEDLKKKFIKCGAIRNTIVSKKKDPKRPGQLLSMGYGFVEFKTQESAMKAIKTLQHSDLDGHTLEIKLSNRGTLQQTPSSGRKLAKETKQTSTKIMVRNIPFEASQKEVLELFSTFGEIKAVRLPKKMAGTGRHRGFGFVDYLSKQDAKRAFDALCHSSHLYGRRLVLEWAEPEESIDELRKKTAEHFSESGPTKKFKKSHLLDDLKSRGLDS